MIESHYKTVLDHLMGNTLCVVTKHRSNEEILSYYNAGERVFAENRANELITKANSLPEDIRWQFIGHLQRNKVASVLPYVSCIQSLDSLPLAEVIEKEAKKLNKTVDCLVEFHLAEEDTNKSGLSEADGISLIESCKS